MDEARREAMRGYLENVQLSVHEAAYTKVPDKWQSLDIVPEINRLYYIREGEGWLSFRGHDFYPQPGQLFWMPARVRQSFSTTGAETFGKYWCHFTAKVGDMHLARLLPLPAFIHVQDHDRLEGLFRQLIRDNTSTDLAASLRIKAALHEIVAMFVEAAERGSERHRTQGAIPPPAEYTESPSIAKINAILSYINEHLDERMTVGALAARAHFHPNYFMQLFKSLLGDSPIVYINRKRMERARQLLMAGDLTVSEIADCVGMELYYFSRTFRKLTGWSPSEYRKFMTATPMGGRRS